MLPPFPEDTLLAVSSSPMFGVCSIDSRCDGVDVGEYGWSCGWMVFTA